MFKMDVNSASRPYDSCFEVLPTKRDSTHECSMHSVVSVFVIRLAYPVPVVASIWGPAEPQAGVCNSWLGVGDPFSLGLGRSCSSVAAKVVVNGRSNCPSRHFGPCAYSLLYNYLPAFVFASGFQPHLIGLQ